MTKIRFEYINILYINSILSSKTLITCVVCIFIFFMILCHLPGLQRMNYNINYVKQDIIKDINNNYITYYGVGKLVLAKSYLYLEDFVIYIYKGVLKKITCFVFKARILQKIVKF